MEKLNCGNMKGSREAKLISMVTSSSTIKQAPFLESPHAIAHESQADAFLWRVQFACTLRRAWK